MQLIAAKSKLRSNATTPFPDTTPVKKHKKSKKRKRNNTQRSPLPKFGDMTPASVVIRDSDSDRTYNSSSNESEPHPSNNGQTLRSNTISNLKQQILQSNKKLNHQRQSRSEIPKSIK